MRRARWTLPVVAVAVPLLLPAPSTAQDERPCSDPLHSAFDFWVGEWEVRLSDGSLAGHNTIRRRAGGCNLAEEWRGASGSTGQSLNFVDPVDGRWHQLWVGSSGLVLRLEGGPYQGGMRMEGRGSDTTLLHRISWTPLEDGRIRQHWEVSGDHGETWSDVFEGFYTALPTVDGGSGPLPAKSDPVGRVRPPATGTPAAPRASAPSGRSPAGPSRGPGAR